MSLLTTSAVKISHRVMNAAVEPGVAIIGWRASKKVDMPAIRAGSRIGATMTQCIARESNKPPRAIRMTGSKEKLARQLASQQGGAQGSAPYRNQLGLPLLTCAGVRQCGYDEDLP